MAHGHDQMYSGVLRRSGPWIAVLAANFVHIWTMEFDELNVPYLVRYQVERE